MSSSDRRSVLAALLVLALAGCGFSPAYAPGGSGAALNARVQADAPGDRTAFEFVTRIEERLGRSDDPRYRLSYTIRTERISAGLTQTGAITRYTMTGSADFALADAATGGEIATGRVDGFTGFFTTGSTVATLAAEEDANRRLMRILADRVVTRLLAAGIAG